MFDQTVVFVIPMRIGFRGIKLREGMLLYRGGSWREWSPFVEYGDAEASRWLLAACEDDKPELKHRWIPVNVTVPVVDPGQAFALVRSSGASTAKVKVADARSSMADDLARLVAVREALGPDGKIRVDANGAWSVDQAFTALRRLAGIGLQYAEQPCASVAEMAELRTRLAEAGVGVPIAADESIRRAGDPHQVVAAQAADLMILKNQPLGGARECVRLQVELGLPAVMSSALETSIGIWAGLRAAAALPNAELACGLGTVALLTDDVVATPLLPQAGYLEVSAAAPEVDEAALARVQAGDDRSAWWQERLRRCLDLVAKNGQGE